MFIFDVIISCSSITWYSRSAKVILFTLFCQNVGAVLLVFLHVYCFQTINDAYTKLLRLSGSRSVLLCSQDWKGEKQLWLCWHFGVSDPQQTSINGVLRFMEVCCVLPAEHRWSQPCQQRWRFAKLHKRASHSSLRQRRCLKHRLYVDEWLHPVVKMQAAPPRARATNAPCFYAELLLCWRKVYIVRLTCTVCSNQGLGLDVREPLKVV